MTRLLYTGNTNFDMTVDFANFSSDRKSYSSFTNSPFQGGDSFIQEFRTSYSNTPSGSDSVFIANLITKTYSLTGEFQFDQGRIVEGLVASIAFSLVGSYQNQNQQTSPIFLSVGVSDLFKAFSPELTSTTIKPSIYEWMLDGNDFIIAGYFPTINPSYPIPDKIYAFAGDDFVFAGGGDDYIDGGSGIDTASYIGKISEYTINRGDAFISIGDLIPNRDGLDTLVNIERLQFVDYTLDVSRTSPIDKSIYLLYKAAFGRAPDLGGFDYWTSATATKGLTISDVAGFFSRSTEFKNLFGENPTNEQYINKLYENILDRVPDITGSAFWTGQLSKGVTKETVLVGFALSDENLKMTEAYTKDGYWLS